MKKEEIQLWDWIRMLFGQTPPMFLFEILIRLVIIYLLMLTSMRLLGNRMAGQLSRTEMVALVSLASAVGVPMHSPDRGLLPSFIVAFIVVLLGRLIAKLSFLNQGFERKVQDDINVIIKDSVINMKESLQSRLSIDRIFAQLRSEGIKHLGEVRRFYFEAGGSFSLIRNDFEKPGLCILPAFDKEFQSTLEEVDQLVCCDCGAPEDYKDDDERCRNCRKNHWARAVK